MKFYHPFFQSDVEVRSFVEACEQLAPPDNVAKIMMHQGQRLVSLSDDIPTIRPHREALRLLFLMMCAENISKLHDGFQGEGQSRAHVRRFFESFLSESDTDALARSFADRSRPSIPRLVLRDAVDMLYDVRCDVVHEGNYWSFAFRDGPTVMVNVNPDVNSHITFVHFRAIVVRGCINAVQDRLRAP
ncbi:hypothetical protein MYX82_12560 [Acidobacteria bacterium AH-259-D05]|nr:hypothetical protein [Acidobacteria bacterium AH-259-D05]